MSFLGIFRRTGYQGPVSDHFDGERFIMPGNPFDKSREAVLKWMLTREKSRWPARVDQPPQVRPERTVGADRVVVTFVNHATLLVQTHGLNILTDPVWSERIGPVSFAGPKRIVQPGIRYEDLPPIHALLLSHNHYDHIDMETVLRLFRDHKPRILAPLGDGDWMREAGIPGIEEMDWWQTLPLSADITATFTPSQHWSARGLFDRCLSLWGSFAINVKGQTFYFAGDTGYGPHFKTIAERFPRIRSAFIPIGAYEPRWFMRYQHNNPDDAVLAHQDLRAEHSIGIHFGCFQLTDEAWDAPARELKLALEKYAVPAADFAVPQPGSVFSYKL
ncbi:MBL fold metallo-hydrolase [Oligoflexus tunisiensis]|uniref:MBL fold metallo-hydrolase n=1 Tax=Oligoflexus tunisiensis TaxID=708132 RepID=UPI000AED2031|nr:MBL fold metallo-hydrolase [Oligoflexus tunisiensis]